MCFGPKFEYDAILYDGELGTVITPRGKLTGSPAASSLVWVEVDGENEVPSILHRKQLRISTRETKR